MPDEKESQKYELIRVTAEAATLIRNWSKTTGKEMTFLASNIILEGAKSAKVRSRVRAWQKSRMKELEATMV